MRTLMPYVVALSYLVVFLAGRFSPRESEDRPVRICSPSTGEVVSAFRSSVPITDRGSGDWLATKTRAANTALLNEARRRHAIEQRLFEVADAYASAAENLRTADGDWLAAQAAVTQGMSDSELDARMKFREATKEAYQQAKLGRNAPQGADDDDVWVEYLAIIDTAHLAWSRSVPQSVTSEGAAQTVLALYGRRVDMLARWRESSRALEDTLLEFPKEEVRMLNLEDIPDGCRYAMNDLVLLDYCIARNVVDEAL